MSTECLIIWLVRSTILLGLTCLVCAFLRKSPAARLILCRAALVGTVVLFLSSPWSYDRPHPIVPIAIERLQPSFLNVPVQSSSLGKSIGATNHQPTSSQEAASNRIGVGDAIPPSKVLTSNQLVGGVWVLGVLTLIAWLGLGIRRMRRMCGETDVIETGPLFESVRAASEAFQTNPPLVRVGSHIASPFVSGVVTPTIYLPEKWSNNLNQEVLDAVCRHEIAHLAANDLRWHLLNRVSEIVFWPQPLLWMIAKIATAASEEVCDAKVLASGYSPQKYATTLLDLKEAAHASRSLIAVGMSDGSSRSEFGRRIHMIMNYRNGTGLLSRKRALLAVVATGIVGLLATLCAMPKHSSQDAKKLIATWPKANGKISVKLVTSDGKVPKAFAGILYDFENGDSQWVQADIIDGVVYADLSQHNTSDRATLVAIVPGYGMSFCRIWPIEKPVTELKLSPAVKLAGSAVPLNGSSAANIPVKVEMLLTPFVPGGPPRRYLTLNEDLKALLSTRTDAKGRFEFPNLPKDLEVRFDFIDPRFASCQQVSSYLNETLLSTAPVTRKPMIHLRPASIFTGRVTRDGKPVAGIHIGAQGNSNAGGSPRFAGSAVTDANGNYRMGRLFPGHYNVAFDERKVNGEVTAFAHEDVVAIEGKTIPNLNFDLISGATIRGKVTDSQGNPLAGAEIGIYGPAHPNSSAWVQMATSGSDGTYVLHVPPGKQRIYIMNKLESKDDDSQTVEVQNGKETTVNFELH